MEEMPMNQYDSLYGVLSIANSFLTHVSSDNDEVMCPSDASGGGNIINHSYTDQRNIHKVEERIPTLQADYDQLVCSSATSGGGNGLHPYTDQHNIDKVEERTLPVYQDREVHRTVITPGTNEPHDKGLQWSGPRAHQRVQCQPSLNENQNSHHSLPHSVGSTPMFSFTQNIIYNPVQQTYNPVQHAHNPVQHTYNHVQHPYNDSVQHAYNDSVQHAYNDSVQHAYNPVQHAYYPVQHAFNTLQHAYNPLQHMFHPLQHTREPYHDPAFYSWTSNNSFQNRLDYPAGYGCMSTLQHIDATRNPSLDVPGTANFSANSLGLPQDSIEQHNKWEPERGEPFEKEESSSLKNPNHLSGTCYVPDISTRFMQINTAKTLRYECSVCHLQIINCTGLKHHMKTHGSGWDQTPVICAICGEVASDVLNLNKHLQSHPQTHVDLPQRRASKVQRNEKGLYECHICDKAFCKRDTHKEHMRVHTGEMPYECNFCKRNYRAQGAYAQHMKTHNTKEGHN